MITPPSYNEGTAKTLPECFLAQGPMVFYLKINEVPDSRFFHGIPFIP
jgi:hypothetical protein